MSLQRDSNPWPIIFIWDSEKNAQEMDCQIIREEN